MGIKQNRAMKHFGFVRLLLGYITPARPKRPCQVIKTVVQIKSTKLSTQGLTSMPSRSPYPVQRRSSFSLGVWALILLGMLFGTMVSSMGGVTSHGLAAFAASQHHVDDLALDAHSHSHEEDDVKPASSDAGAEHAHHGADHSHDKSHVPSHAMTVAMSMAASRPATARPWVELVAAFRLERPPMA